MSSVAYESDWLTVTGFFLTEEEVLIKCDNGQEYVVPYNACPAPNQVIKIQFDANSNPIEWRIKE